MNLIKQDIELSITEISDYLFKVVNQMDVSVEHSHRVLNETRYVLECAFDRIRELEAELDGANKNAAAIMHQNGLLADLNEALIKGAKRCLEEGCIDCRNTGILANGQECYWCNPAITALKLCGEIV